MWLDAHVHISPDAVASIDRLLALWDSAGVAGGVAIQPRLYGADHSYLVDALAHNPDRLRGILLVDPVDAFDPVAVRRLYPAGFAGFRLVLGHGSAPWPSVEAAAPVFRLARELGAVVGILAEPQMLRTVHTCAARFPDVTVVVDHLGFRGPDLFALAELSNVYVKVSALGALSSQPAPFPDLAEFIGRTVARFGPARLMWGTDFPHALQYTGYGLTREAAAILLAGLNPEDRAMISGRNAARLYGFERA